MAEAGAVYAAAFREGLRPPPELTVGEWADEFRMLSAKASAEPGRYRVERTPYLREIMDCLSTTSPVEEVVFIKGAQVGATEAGLCWVGYIIAHAPAPTLMVQPTVEMAKRASKQRIDPMIEATPALRTKVRDARERDSGNTMLSKEFSGGFLILTGANSSVGLSSMPAKNVFLDELDRFPADVDGEGAPAELARRRTATFLQRKVFSASTPTNKGASAIEAEFEQTDKRYYHVPCPKCGHKQVLKWERIRWSKLASGKPDLKTVRYACAGDGCDALLEEHHKTAMLAGGKWRATAPEAKGGKVVGFHLSALYSPVGWYSWADAVADWDKAQDQPHLMRVFVNTVLGETYEVKGEDTPDWKRIYERREQYKFGVVPSRAALLTAGVDVQKDRLEAFVVGWWKRESWLVEHQVLVGDTSKPEVWRQLDEVLAREWAHEGGQTLAIRVMCIDSGFNTTHVYEYVRRKSARQVLAIKGDDALQLPIGQPKMIDYTKGGKRIRRGVRLWRVGVSILKEELYGALKLEAPTDEERAVRGYPTGFVHFPMVGEDFFKQLVAEQFVVTKTKTGHARYEWVKTYPRNEALDGMVYNRAAWYAAGAHRMNDAAWERLATDVGAVVEEFEEQPLPAAAGDEPAPPPAPPRAPIKRKPRVVIDRGDSFW